MEILNYSIDSKFRIMAQYLIPFEMKKHYENSTINDNNTYKHSIFVQYFHFLRATVTDKLII